jgi:hypothetical protein
MAHRHDAHHLDRRTRRLEPLTTPRRRVRRSTICFPGQQISRGASSMKMMLEATVPAPPLDRGAAGSSLGG